MCSVHKNSFHFQLSVLFLDCTRVALGDLKFTLIAASLFIRWPSLVASIKPALLWLAVPHKQKVAGAYVWDFNIKDIPFISCKNSKKKLPQMFHY